MRGRGCGGAASASTQLSNVLSGSPSGPGRRGGLSVLAANQLRLCGGLLAFWQRRPANPFLRSAFDPFFCFRGVFELSASSVFLPSSRCNTAHRVRRHVKSWFGATPCRRATKLPLPVSGQFGGYFNQPCDDIDASACGHCPPWRRRQSDQQTIAVYRGAASEHSASARLASSASPGERFKVKARSSAPLHSAYCLSWR